MEAVVHILISVLCVVGSSQNYVSSIWTRSTCEFWSAEIHQFWISGKPDWPLPLSVSSLVAQLCTYHQHLYPFIAP